MADEIDLANELAQHALNAAVERARTGAKLDPKGTCFFCDAPLDASNPAASTLFCDADCKDDWEKEQNVRKKQNASRGR